ASYRYGRCHAYRSTAQSGSATNGWARRRSLCITASAGRRIGPVSPASSASGARSPSSTCCNMWKENIRPPSACTGDTNATSSVRMPSANSATRQRGTGVPRSRSVRTRGAVNVVVQPGQWELPRVDHLGFALDEEDFVATLARAEVRELRVHEHGGRRTFVSTNAGYRLELHPPRDWLDDLLAGSPELQL